MELRRENADAKQAIRTATGSRAPAEQPPAIGDPDCDRFPAADAASDYGCVDWYQYWPQSPRAQWMALLQATANRCDSLSVEAEPVHSSRVAGVLDLDATIHDD
jgi:hypothetical protein